jgi:hypothetical protein
MKTEYDNKLMPNILHTKFLGINADSTLPWRTHTEQLISRLSTANYVIRSIKSYMSHKILMITYYSFIHSIINYVAVL